VLRVNVLVTIVNAVFDYLWIFGKGGFPRMGVAGAAWSTVTSQVVGAALFLVGLLMRRRFRAGGWKSLRVIEPASLELQGRTT
jgi:MATE family, multidrug efflux pump